MWPLGTPCVMVVLPSVRSVEITYGVPGLCIPAKAGIHVLYECRGDRPVSPASQTLFSFKHVQLCGLLHTILSEAAQANLSDPATFIPAVFILDN